MTTTTDYDDDGCDVPEKVPRFVPRSVILDAAGGAALVSTAVIRKVDLICKTVTQERMISQGMY